MRRPGQPRAAASPPFCQRLFPPPSSRLPLSPSPLPRAPRFTAFVIELRTHGGMVWSVERRFSEFHDLNQVLKQRYEELKIFKFPPKRWFSSFAMATVEQRRATFEQYLRELLTLQPRRGGGYEGPTGIMTVVTNAARDAGIPTGSIWANVPHYVNASPNPKATLGLLDRLNNGLGLNLRLNDMEVFVARFDAQVAEEIAKNPEMGDYARRIEDQQDEVDDGLVEANGAQDEPDSEDELPDAADMVSELERFLREQRGQDSGS